MQITRNGLDTGPGPADWFTGAVFIDTIAAPAQGSRIGAARVHFAPGARTAWHTHPHGQTIWVSEGVGLCRRRGGPIEVPDRGRAAAAAIAPLVASALRWSDARTAEELAGYLRLRDAEAAAADAPDDVTARARYRAVLDAPKGV